MSDLIKTSVYLKKDNRNLFDDVCLLLKEQKTKVINEALENHLKKLIKENKLEKKLETLKALKD